MNTFLSILSAILMVVGYIFYIKKTLKNEIDPNPMTWLMFTYGTSLLTILEWENGAGWLVTLTPIVCSASSFYVAYLCHRKQKLTWPEDKQEKIAFMLDLLLTFMYLASWLGTKVGFISMDVKSILVLLFLIGSNATTFTAFWPILKGTYVEPKKESSLPWVVWTASYLCLVVPTYNESIADGDWELLIYPFANSFLHGAVALLSIRKKPLSV